MRLERYCTCGGVLKTTVPLRKRQQTLMVWYDQHHGDGHADTDASGAEQARMGGGQPGGREYERTRKR